MKKILFISPDFFDYYLDIKKELENQGFEVTWFNDRPSNSLFTKAIIRLNKKVLNKKIEKYIDSILETAKNENFEYVLILFGQSFSKKHIQTFRKVLPNARFIYYTWDSCATFPFILEIYKEFDIAYSFDDSDCEKYGFKHLPLFYSNEKLDIQVEYDAASILTIKRGKLDNYHKIESILPNDILVYKYLYLQSKMVYLYFKIRYKEFRHARLKDFNYTKLSRKTTNKIFASSKVIIDCQMENQNGITMRTFEALHLNKKVITTNSNIKKYDFYTPNNIFIVDDQAKKIPEEFFNSEFDTNYALSEKYSLKHFVEQLMEE